MGRLYGSLMESRNPATPLYSPQAGLLTCPVHTPSRLPTVALSMDSACAARTHSNGYCPGFPPDSLLRSGHDTWLRHHMAMQK